MNEDIKLMIDDCIKREAKLTEWEQNFVKSIKDNETLTDRQFSILNKIWDKVTG